MRSATANEIKLLRKLSLRKYRERVKQFIAEGERTVQQILENGSVEVISVFVKQGQGARFKGQIFNASFSEIDESVFDEISDTENTQGILALCKIPEEPDLTEIANQEGIILATDAIQDPGNMGTIIRTAAWFGVKAILVGKGSVDVYHPKVVRSTAGATGSIPIISGDLVELLQEMKKKGWEILLLDGGNDSENLTDIQPSNKTILVVGNEANGIDDKLINKYKAAKIEGDSKSVESLNAAVAVSISLWALSSRLQ